MAALQPCISNKEFKANYAYVYFSHLSPKYQLVVKENFPECQYPTPLDSHLQRKKLQQLKVAGTTAASRLLVTQMIANQSVQSYATLAGDSLARMKGLLENTKTMGSLSPQNVV